MSPAASSRLLRAGRLLPWVTAAGAAAFLVRTLALPHEPIPFWDGWLFHALLLLATAACGLRAVLVAPERWAWAALTAAAGIWMVSSVWWQVTLSGVDDPPYPSLADAGWLLFYPLAYTGVVLLVRERVPAFSRSVWLDGLVGGMAVAGIGAALVFDAIMNASEGDAAAVVTNLAYPLADLALLAVVIGGMAATGWQRQSSFLLLAVALVALAVSDVTYLYKVATETYLEGSPVDAGWPIGMVLLAFAAWRQPGALEAPAPNHRAALGFTGLFTIVALGLLVYGTMTPASPLSPVAAGFATLTLLAAAARTALAFTELSRMAETRRQAITDELTGLPNRRRLYHCLEEAVADAAPREERLAVLLIDLDGFKEINDTLGHGAGDQLLQQLGPRLGEGLGPHDVLGRLGGDEFAVVLPRADAFKAMAAARRIRRRLDEPFLIEGLSLVVDASVGIAVLPDHADTAEELIQRADVAMYRAKETRAGAEVYAQRRDTHSRDRLTLLSDLGRALETGEIVPHFQPQADARTGAVVGAEALVRWEHPELELLTPAHFLPAAEQTGLMRPLTLRMLAASVEQLVQWRDDGLDLHVSVNLAVVNMLDRQLPADIARLLFEHGVPPSKLIVEVTEGVVMADPDRAATILAEMRRMGVGVALDDFGTGHSSLAWLKQLPVDEIKIDRTFVKDLATDPGAAAIVRATVDLARAFGLRTVAEGPEDDETWRQLTLAGCDLVQGYVLSRPQPAAQLTAWLLERRSAATAPRVGRLSS